VPGRYFLDCWVRQDQDGGDMAVQGLRLLEFAVYGTAPPYGIVSVQADLEAAPEQAPSDG
jgi:hypothetical protein